jgi:hypothetical protein
VSQAPGWYRDPFLRGHERYWDGRLWTQGTRPAEGEGTGTNGSAASADNADHADHADEADHGGQIDEQPSPRESGDAGWAAPSVPAVPSFAPLGTPVRPAVTTPGPGATQTVGAAATPGSGHQGRGRGRHRVAFGVSAAAVTLIVAGLASVFTLGGGGTSGQASAAEAVVTAATQTINANSADVSMSMRASATGTDESLSASGSFDFAQKTGTMTMTIPTAGQQFSEQEIIDGSTIYVNVSGLDTGLDPSKPWVSVPVDQSDSSSTDISTLDATALLHQLQSVGGSVTSLGQTDYDGTGTLVTEYQTTLPASALEASMGALPSASGQNTSGLDLPDMTIDVYVTQDDLLKALVVPTYSFDFVGETVSVEMTLTFSNFGTPVNVTPPPADQVQPLPVCGCENNSGSTGNTGNSGDFGNSGSTT